MQHGTLIIAYKKKVQHTENQANTGYKFYSNGKQTVLIKKFLHR